HSGSGSTTSGGGRSTWSPCSATTSTNSDFSSEAGALAPQSGFFLAVARFFAGDLTVALPMAAQRQPNQKVPVEFQTLCRQYQKPCARKMHDHLAGDGIHSPQRDVLGRECDDFAAHADLAVVVRHHRDCVARLAAIG